MNRIPKNKIAVNEKNSHIWDEDDDGGEQNQVYATVKNTYLGTSGPEKYFNVTITMPTATGNENI